MSTKSDVIAAIGEIATAHAALVEAINDLRDANSARGGAVVANTDVTSGGNSLGNIIATTNAKMAAVRPLAVTVDEKIVAADAVADALT